MLTIFSIPKPFEGHIAVIQENAIASWVRLQPACEIILCGDENGSAEIAAKFKVKHIPKIARNDYGTPFVNAAFEQAEHEASNDLMCYVNADIILVSNFLRAAETVQKRFPKSLLISKRINLHVPEKLTFDRHWEDSIKLRSEVSGAEEHYTGIDVFVFPKGMYPQIPDFAIGRLWFDHWLIKAVRQQHLPVVDASLVAPVLHQNHDYNHVPGGADQVWRGQEAARNFQLYGGVQHAYTLLDVTHELLPNGSIRKVRFRKSIFKAKQFAWDLLVRRTAAARRALGLRRKPV